MILNVNAACSLKSISNHVRSFAILSTFVCAKKLNHSSTYNKSTVHHCHRKHSTGNISSYKPTSGKTESQKIDIVSPLQYRGSGASPSEFV